MNATNTPSLARGLQEFLSRSSATIAVETSILFLIGLIAIGGNLLVVISIYRNPSLRTTTNYYVFSLAMTDILYSVMVLPVTVAWSIKSRFDLETELCDFQGISANALFFLSILNMVFMAVNRFIKVCDTHKYQKLLKKNNCLVIIGAIWMGSFASITLYNKAGNFASIGFKPGEIRCGFIYKTLHNTASKIIGNSLLIVCLVVPFTVITFCYFKVFKKIREHKKKIFPRESFELRSFRSTQAPQCSHGPSRLPSSHCTARNVGGSSRKGRNLGTSVQEIKITWTLFAVLLGYCVSWIPVFIIMSTSSFAGEKNIPRSAQMIVTYTGSSSCAINPIIYGVMNPAFRREYKKIFSCK